MKLLQRVVWVYTLSVKILEQKGPLLQRHHSCQKKMLTIQSAQLIANIDQLQTDNPHICTTGGPSDDFSKSDAIRNTSFSVPWYHFNDSQKNNNCAVNFLSAKWCARFSFVFALTLDATCINILVFRFVLELRMRRIHLCCPSPRSNSIRQQCSCKINQTNLCIIVDVATILDKHGTWRIPRLSAFGPCVKIKSMSRVSRFADVILPKMEWTVSVVSSFRKTYQCILAVQQHTNHTEDLSCQYLFSAYAH
jgi:hypothetical protein